MKRLILAICISQAQVQSAVDSAVCKALCRRDGHHSGYAPKEGGCACIELKPSIENYIRRASANIGKIPVPDPVVPFRTDHAGTGRVIYNYNLNGDE